MDYTHMFLLLGLSARAALIKIIKVNGAMRPMMNVAGIGVGAEAVCTDI